MTTNQENMVIFTDDDIVDALERELHQVDCGVNLPLYLEMAQSLGHETVLYLIKRGILLDQASACEACGAWHCSSADFCPRCDHEAFVEGATRLGTL